MTTYRHTQVGWQTYAVLIPAILAAMFMFVTRDAFTFTILVALLLLVFLAFGWLTVDIDQRRLKVVFGVGLIRRTIALDTIRAFAAVKNPWYYGWGIRLTPHGILYNVAGLNAVELLLDDGRRVRVGTDEPANLVSALAGATRVAPSHSTDAFPKDAVWRRRTRLLSIGSVALVATILFGQLFFFSREPSVGLAGGTLSVGLGVYGANIPVSAIESVTLADALPRIVRRTNGFGAGDILRGQFFLEEWGAGQLFIRHNSPPYVVVRTNHTFVVVNFDDAARTRALYEQLRNSVVRP